MPAQQQQQSQGGDSALGPFWIIIGIFALIAIIWYIGHVYISMGVLKLRLFEAYLISLFTPDGDTLITLIKNSSPADMTYHELYAVSGAVGVYLRYPIAIILFVLSVVIYFSNPILNFRKTYSIQGLVDSEKDNWPQIMPVAKLDLVQTDIDKGPWAMALTPMQFAKKYRLLREERVVSNDPNVLQHARTVVTVRREDANQIFSLQLGRYWMDVENLNIHTKALFAIFAARANRDSEGARKLLIQIAASTSSGKLDFSGTEALLAKHKNFKAVVRVMQNHAFVFTVMASMLELARTDGVLATADFLWLKPVDRTLWYMLNSVGRQTPFVEVAGPFAHWLAEKTMRRKLKVPMLDESTSALEIAIKDVIYIPDEEE